MALKHPDAVASPAKNGSVAVGSTPDEFEDFMRAEAEKWGPGIKTAIIKFQ